MIRLVPLLFLASVGAQGVVPFFRPDSVSVVTGRVLCGSRAASGVLVEWWADRGQFVDVKLGEARTDGNGNFQVRRTIFEDSKTYLFIKNTCGTGGSTQSSRFEVDLGRPSNLQLQLNQNGGNDSPTVDISGRVLCQQNAVPFSVVEWWEDRGSSVDVQLGTTVTDASGFFRLRSRVSGRATYLIVKHNCRGASNQNSRFDINLNNANNMQLQLVQGNGHGNGITQVGGRVSCGNRRLSNTLVEWFTRGRRDQFIGSTRTFNDGSFSIRANRRITDDSYVTVSHNCDSNRIRTSRFDVDWRRPTNMQLDVKSRRSSGSDSHSHERSLSDDPLLEVAEPYLGPQVDSTTDAAPEHETPTPTLAVQSQETETVVLYPTIIEQSVVEEEDHQTENAVPMPLDGTERLNILLNGYSVQPSTAAYAEITKLVPLPVDDSL